MKKTEKVEKGKEKSKGKDKGIKVEVERFYKTEKTEGKEKSYVKNNDSIKTEGSSDIRIDERADLVPVNEQIYDEPVETVFNQLDDNYVREHFGILKRKWLGELKLSDPIIKILEVGFKNFGVTEEDLTMERLSIGFKKAKYEVAAWHTYFFQTDQLYTQDQDSQLEYSLIFNKISEILWYMEKTIRNIFRTKLVLDPEYDSSMNDDNDLLRFRPLDIKAMSDYQQLYFILTTILFEKRYRRYGDFCYKRVFNDSGKFTYSWKEAMSIEKFVYSQTNPSSSEGSFLLATSAKNTNINEIIKLLRSVDDPKFPDLKKDRHVFSFRNGVYIAKYKKDENGYWCDYFYPYGATPPLPSTVVASKYFDIEFDNYDDIEDWYKIPTSNFQKIIDYQFRDEHDYEHICRWFYIIIGKMMYCLKELDRWQILPFLLGQAGSGKCFARGTKVMMIDGKIKEVQDIRQWEILMGDDAQPRIVFGVTQGYGMLYSVEQEHGETYVVNGSHILSLVDVAIGNNGRVIDISVEDYLQLPEKRRKTLHGYKILLTNLKKITRLINVTRVSEGMYYGFQVDRNQRFLLHDYTVTHNSTLTKVIMDIYDPNDVGTIENKNEEIFGLAPIHDKYIYIMSEVKRNFNMDQAILQKIISGEKVSLPRKHVGPISVVWSSPGFMCANEVPGFGDAAGSMSRRLFIFKYKKKVWDGVSDPQLDTKLEKEMAAIIKKTNKAYLDAVKRFSHKDIWKVVPKYFHQTKEALGQETNPLKHFLASGKVIFAEGIYIQEKVFKGVFKDHCLENNLGKPRWSATLYEEPFSFFSYKEKVNITFEKNTRKVYPRNQARHRPHGTFILGVDVITDEEEPDTISAAPTPIPISESKIVDI